jgi:hypothetical protein
MKVQWVERAAKVMAEADLWPEAWDGGTSDGYAMPDAEKKVWTHRASAALAAVIPAIRRAALEEAAGILDTMVVDLNRGALNACADVFP